MRISDWSSDVCSSDLRESSDKLDVFVVARLLFHIALPGGTGQLGVDRGRGVGGLLRRDAACACVRAQIGRASCRERVCQYGSISVVAVSLKKKKQNATKIDQ